MNKILLLIVTVALFAFGCQSKYQGVPGSYEPLLDSAFVKAGENATELTKALDQSLNYQKEATAFLIAYMPQNDLKTLPAGFVLDQVKEAWKVRKEFEWCQNLPDSIFLNEVLPYFNLDEKRENWRNDFYERFAPLVRNCNSIFEAIDSVNQNIRDVLEVDYNTKRSTVNSCPSQAIKEKMATCTGLSILLTDAFRSVGIPARVAGTPLWTNLRGNHNWVEVWINGQWYFTEYYPDKLNKSWFLTDAGKADPEKPIHWIYAASYKPTGVFFPLVWNKNAKAVNGVNVTNRYIRLYQQQLEGKKLGKNEILVDVVLYKNSNSESAENRVSEKVTILEGNKKVDFGFTPMPTDDLNKFLKFKLKKNTTYHFAFSDTEGNEKSEEFEFKENSKEVLKLAKE